MKGHKVIVFKTPGVLDPLAIQTFGVSVKEGDNPIGFFGTGLKYAIAILLRENQELKIISGGKELKFCIQPTHFRGTEQQIVAMNNLPLGFTTHLGKLWKLWMAYRELWSNTVDEGGEVFFAEKLLHIDGESTYICVDGEKFGRIHQRKNEFILSQKLKPFYSHPRMDMFPIQTHTVFYRGIRVFKNDVPFAFTYNLLGEVPLTEDRTLKYQALYLNNIMRNVMASRNIEMIRSVLTAPEGTWEQGFQWGVLAGEETSDEFAKEVENLFQNGRLTNLKAFSFVMSSRPGLNLKVMETNPVQEQQLNRAMDFCRRLGYKVDLYKIVSTDSVPNSVFGAADQKDNTIYITRRAYEGGTKQVAITLMEECIHLMFNLHDETREMQEFLLHKIVSMAEEIQGEPL